MRERRHLDLSTISRSLKQHDTWNSRWHLCSELCEHFLVQSGHRRKRVFRQYFLQVRVCTSFSLIFVTSLLHWCCLHRPQMKVIFFRGICHSVGEVGRQTSPLDGDAPPPPAAPPPRPGMNMGQHMKWYNTPFPGKNMWPDTSPPARYWHLVTATVAVGTHPPGMHSCFWK